MERCPNCGASIRTGARFCTACGFRLLQPSDAPTIPSPVVTPAETDDAVAGTQTPFDASSPSESGRVVWHGDPKSVSAGDGTPDERDSGEFNTSPGIKDGPANVSVDPLTVQQDDAASHQTAGTWPLEHEQVSTASGSADDSSPVVPESGASSSIDDAPLASTSSTTEQDPDDSSPEEEAASGTTDDERLGIEQPQLEQVDAAVGINHPGGADTPGGLDASRSDAVIAASDDQLPPQIETAASRLDPNSADQEAGQGDDSGSSGRGGTATDSVEGGAPLDARSEDSGPAAEDGSTGQDEPAIESIGWQDDVVIDTSFMAETDQPGYYNADGERPSLPDDTEPTQDAGLADPDLTSDHASFEGKAGTDSSEAATDSTTLSTGTDTSGGRDDDWEPWGAGGVDVPDSAGDRPGGANGLPIEPTDLLRPEQPRIGAAGAGTAEIAHARLLLEELRATLDSLETAAPQPATDPAVELAIDSVAEIGQILDGLPPSSIEADRLAELTRLAEDLTGRDFDIRALQRFAQERESILNLATEVQQQRDVMAQIRSVLVRSRP